MLSEVLCERVTIGARLLGEMVGPRSAGDPGGESRWGERQ